MTETNLTADQEIAVESHSAQYVRVFWILCFFTICEYFYARIFADHSFAVLLLGLMGMAIFKATMVGLYFMHLKFEGAWVYRMLIPVVVLAAILTLALFPDVAMQPVTEENPELDGVESTSVAPAAATSILRPTA